jgi:hypothetical protein
MKLLFDDARKATAAPTSAGSPMRVQKSTRTQLAAIDGLDTGVRRGPDPDSITLEPYGKVVPEA